MQSKMKREVSWNLLELSGLLEDEDCCVHYERAQKHFALHPFHLTNLQSALNEILSFTLNSYDAELKGFVLAYKNIKSLSALGETFYDNCFIHVDIEADFYIFRPKVGCSLKGIVSKKGLDYIVVLVNKTFTVSIPKPEDTETWPGDSVEIGQEVKCYVTHIDKNAKLPFICATLDLDYLQNCRLPHNMNNIEDTKMIIERNTLDNVNQIVDKSSVAETENDTIPHKEKKKSSKRKRSHETDLKPVRKIEHDVESVNHMNNIEDTEMITERNTLDNTNQIVDKLSVAATENDTIPHKKGKKHSKRKKSHVTDLKSVFKVERDIESVNHMNNIEDTEMVTERNTLDNVNQIVDKLNVIAREKVTTTTHEERKKSSKRKRSETDLKPVCKIEPDTESVNDTVNHPLKKIKYEDKHENTQNNISNNDHSLIDSEFDSVPTKRKKRKKILKELSDLELKDHIVKVKNEKPESITNSPIKKSTANHVELRDVSIILERCTSVERSIKRENSIKDIFESQNKKTPKKHRRKTNESDSEPVSIKKIRKVNNTNNSFGMIKNNNEQYQHIKHETTYTDTLSSNTDLDCISKKPKKWKISLKMPNRKIES